MLNWVGYQPMKMKETSRALDKKLTDNNYLQGKTFLVAIFCVTRSVLYPGTRICIASGKRAQSAEVIDKIVQILMPNSPLLRNEIEKVKTDQTDYMIKFKCGSVIKIVTASDSSRSNRANILINQIV